MNGLTAFHSTVRFLSYPFRLLLYVGVVVVGAVLESDPKEYGDVIASAKRGLLG